jgi:prephenate dehydratase
LFVTQHRPGTLQLVLRQLSERQLNLTRIESRPLRRGTEPWEYLFFVDFDGHPEDAVVAEALTAMRASCQRLQVLGAWPIEDQTDDAPGPARPLVQG